MAIPFAQQYGISTEFVLPKKILFEKNVRFNEVLDEFSS